MSGHLRKSLGRLVAVFAVLAVALVAVLGAVPGTALAEDELEPGYTKKLVPNPNGDGTYIVSLDVTGSVRESKDDRTPIDVVLVFDTSGSMGSGEGSLMETARSAAKTLVEQLLSQNEDGAVRMSIVDFNTNAKMCDLSSRGQAAYYWSDSEDVIDRALNQLEADGGTNWEAGLKQANEASSGRNNAEKYIIFLSDGDPTFRNSSVVTTPAHTEFGMWGSWGRWIPLEEGDRRGHYQQFDAEYDEDDQYYYWYGVHGAGDDAYYEGKTNWNYQPAVDEANNRGNAQLYTVELTDTSKMYQFATDTHSKYLNGKSTESLLSAFEQIAQEITKSYSFGQVKITDALSQWAEFVDANGAATGTPTFTYQKGKGENLEAWNDAPTASIEDGLITWDLTSVGKLEQDTTYRISFVVRPNQDAYDKAINGAPDTSSTGEKGFFSNNNEKAQLTYSIVTQVNDGEPQYGSPQTVRYEQPVMSVPTSTLTIQKSWEGEAVDLPQSVSVYVYMDGQTNPLATVELSATNEWTANVIVAAGPEGHTYSISEIDDPDDGWTNAGYKVNGQIGSSIKLSGLVSQTASFTVINEPESFSLHVNKVDSDTKDPLYGAKFELYRDSNNDGKYDPGADSMVGNEFAIDQSSGFAKIEDLTSGTYFLVETYVPAGYQLATDPYKIVVSSSGIQFASSESGELGPASPVVGEDRTYQVSFENTKAVTEIPSTGGIGDFPLYACGVAAFAGFVAAIRRTKQD